VIVLDANAAIRFVIDAEENIGMALASHEEVIAPAIYYAETSNAVLYYLKAGLLDIQKIKPLLLDLSHLVTILEPVQPHVEIISLAKSNNLSYYDAEYLMMAIQYNVKLLTLDKKLFKAAESLGFAYQI